jgi:cystathionine beta-lyase
MNSNHIETLVLHAGIEPDPTTGAIMTPIFQTSTYVQAAPGDHKGYEYARTQNPTRDVLQKNLAALEGTKHGLCFSTGMGAVDACAKLLQPGDEVVSTNDLYGGTYRLFTKIFAQYGIKFHFVDMSDESAVRAVMNKNTKMVWVETPTNPLLRIIDIELMIQIGHEFGSIVVVDNTFASPYLQKACF